MTEIKGMVIALLVVSLVVGGFQIFFDEAGQSYAAYQAANINLTLFDQSETIRSNISTTEDTIGTQIVEGTSSGSDLGFRGTITVLKQIIVAVPNLMWNFTSVVAGSLPNIPPFVTITIQVIFVVILIFAVFAAVMKWKS